MCTINKSAHTKKKSGNLSYAPRMCVCVSVCVCVYPTAPHELNVTQGEILRGVSPV